MGLELALKALEASLAGDSATPDHGAPDREMYLACQRGILRTRLVAPSDVFAQADERAQREYGWGSAPYPMTLLAYDAEGVGNCLLFDQASGKFAHAYGHPKTGKPLDLAGHSSNDALFEWLA